MISLLFLLTIITTASLRFLLPNPAEREAGLNAKTNFVAFTLLFIAFLSLLLKSGITGIGETYEVLWLSTHWLNVLLFAMIAFLGFVILKYSINYLGGDPNKKRFIGNIGGALSSAMLLVTSNHYLLLFLAWIGASYFLNKLLLHYGDRPGAQQAALKKFIMARMSDLFLGIAILLLYRDTHTWNIDLSFSLAEGNVSPWVAYHLVLAAIFKAAQFPFHGWLVEVMETPTPVSALLHAGLLNAGPFLILRVSPLLENSYAALVLMGMGGLSMLFGAMAQAPQTSVKTALAYSSIGHMGLSLFLSGSGLYTAALLHLMAHSTYKAYEFLSSGSTLSKPEIPASVNLTSAREFWTSVALTILLFGLPIFGYLHFYPQQEKLLVIALIFSIGVNRFILTALKLKGTFTLLVMAAQVVFTLASFFWFEMGIESLIADSHHNQWSDTLAKWHWMLGIATPVVLIGFLFQGSKLPRSAWGHRWSIHFKNGLYVNDYFDHHIGPRVIPYLKKTLHLHAL